MCLYRKSAWNFCRLVYLPTIKLKYPLGSRYVGKYSYIKYRTLRSIFMSVFNIRCICIGIHIFLLNCILDFIENNISINLYSCVRPRVWCLNLMNNEKSREKLVLHRGHTSQLLRFTRFEKKNISPISPIGINQNRFWR